MSNGHVEIVEEIAKVEVTGEDTVTVVTEEVAQAVEIGIAGPQGASIVGPQGDPGPPGAGFQYVHTQTVASASWTVNHNLGGFPSVTVVDSAGTVVEGEVDYVDANTVSLLFSAPFSGQAFLS